MMGFLWEMLFINEGLVTSGIRDVVRVNLDEEWLRDEQKEILGVARIVRVNAIAELSAH